LMLCVRPMTVAPDGKPTTVHVVHVELRGNDLTDLQTRALEMARFHRSHKLEMQKLQRELGLLVSDPGLDESEEEQAEVQQEFHPEEAEKTADSVSDLGKSAKTEAEKPAEAEPENTEKPVVQAGGLTEPPTEKAPAKSLFDKPSPEMLDDVRKFEKKEPAHPEMKSEPPKEQPKQEAPTHGIDLDKLPEVKKLLRYIPDVKTSQGINMKRTQWGMLREEGNNKVADELVTTTLDRRLAEIEAKEAADAKK